jgi:EmrB/QacA subfamily drug resistance transporter
MLLSSLGSSIANVGLPTLAHAFDATFQQTQWIVIAYLLAITTLIVSVARLGDLIGHRRLLSSGILVFTVGALLCGIAPTLSMLIAARAVQGMGAAVMMALTMAFVAGTVPKARTGSAMGLLGAMSSFGTALGPTLGGLLISAFGWPGIFFVNVPLGTVAWLLARRFLPADGPVAIRTTPAFDGVGTVLLALTLLAYTLAMTLGRGRFGLLNVAMVGGALIGLACFIAVEMRTPSPLVRLGMFRNPVLSTGFAMSVLVMTVMMATLLVGPFYLSGALALGPAHVGLAMSSGAITAALVGMPAGRAVDRFGAARTAAAALIAMTIGCIGLSLMPLRLSVLGYIVPTVLAAAGYALFQAANNTAVMQDVPAAQRGLTAGMLGLSRSLGSTTGASVMGLVFAAGSAATGLLPGDPDAVAAGMRFTFAIAAVLLVVAAGMATMGRVLAGRGGAPAQ